MPAGAETFSSGGKKPIAWGKPYLEGGLTIVPGSLKADFGRFDFFWSITGRGEVWLMTREPIGSAEKGMRDVVLHPYFAGAGSAFIFMERKPLLGSEEPHSLTLVAEVFLDELMAGLAMGKKFSQNLPQASIEESVRISRPAGAFQPQNSLQLLSVSASEPVGRAITPL